MQDGFIQGDTENHDLLSLVEEVHADRGRLGLPLEREVLDVLRLVAHHRDEGVLVQVQALDRQHRRGAHVQLRTVR